MPHLTDLPNEEYIPLLVQVLGPRWTHTYNSYNGHGTLTSESGVTFVISNTLKLVFPDLQTELKKRFGWAILDPNMFEFGYYISERLLAEDIILTEQICALKFRYEILANIFDAVPGLKTKAKWHFDQFRQLMQCSIDDKFCSSSKVRFYISFTDNGIDVSGTEFQLSSPNSISKVISILKEFDSYLTTI